MNFYSVSLNIDKKPCAVVGGGKVAKRKIGRLLEAGAFVDVYSPVFDEEILALKDERLTCLKTDFLSSDKNYSLVIAATNDSDFNDNIAKYCAKNKILCNNVSSKESSDFLVQTELKAEDLTLTIASGGKSPEFVRQLGQFIGKNYLEKWTEALWVFSYLRERIHESVSESRERTALSRQINLEKILDLLQDNDKETVAKKVEKWLLS